MRLLALLLAVCMLLGACSWMSGAYSSIRPHTQSYSSTNRETPTGSAATFLELRSAICDLVDQAQERGLIVLAGYDPQSLQGDVRSAVEYALESYPLGCYALENLRWELGTSGKDQVLRLTLSYRLSRSAIASIQKVRTPSAARTLIQQAMASCDSLVVFQVSNYSETDFLQMIQDYARRNPDLVMETPQAILSFYPQEGTRRLVEIQLSYQNDREELRRMQREVQQVVQSATLYLLPDCTAMEHYGQLYTFLMERFHYSLENSVTPAYSLLLHGVGDSRAFASVFSLLCQKAGLYCQTVSGTRNGESWNWNLISDGQQFFHVDLLRGGEFTPLEDWRMEGYVWDYSAYPASVAAVQPTGG